MVPDRSCGRYTGRYTGWYKVLGGGEEKREQQEPAVTARTGISDACALDLERFGTVLVPASPPSPWVPSPPMIPDAGSIQAGGRIIPSSPIIPQGPRDGEVPLPPIGPTGRATRPGFEETRAGCLRAVVWLLRVRTGGFPALGSVSVLCGRGTLTLIIYRLSGAAADMLFLAARRTRGLAAGGGDSFMNAEMRRAQPATATRSPAKVSGVAQLARGLAPSR
ncbi:predicted protein [Histoplasma mississippiense (nom. inval.)]|uniref:predicted protein n=1 Tax=Ajellomyces capsulatus (strain NAm1 / WU24) TaxID=2059318 RepID=UPI000157BA71|nr:predicted protein [Histoplasma mississippiense (nom. inval.)]EDN05877.1 predicted protein [Histoplasma mississippiense (nom. inval.)]